MVTNYYLINFIYLKNFLFHDINKKHINIVILILTLILFDIYLTLILFEKAYTMQATYYT